VRLTTTKQYDTINRLSSIGNAPSGDTTGSYAYNYNNANQRIKTTLADGSYWVYQYDNLGQVISGKRYWSDATPVAGQQFEYGFDDIGNRELAKSGGNSSGTGLRTETYTPTLLNQYSQRTEANTFDVMGLANASATVTVNTQSTYRKNEYFQKALTVSNGSNPVWQQVDIVATLGGSSTSSTGFVYTAKTPVVYTHDDDGNLVMDGQWMNVWDAENRLISQQSLFTVPTAAKKKLEYEYDYRGRRIRKKTYDWNGSAWVADEDVRFVYDGWNLIAEINASDVIQQSYMWGLDLSGSLQGAGGVGGLVKMQDHGTGKHYFYGYDGNGNVMSLVDGDAGTYAANYEYGPFGETLRASGAMAMANPFRFSTKYQDDETDQYYYGFRYYDPEDGRWLNRDPLEESGGLNLYTFVLNSPTRYVDRDGLDIWIEGPNQREPNLHQSVCVGDPNGNYKSYSFGANGNWVIGGEVYEDTSLGGAIEQYKKTTPEQDQQFRDQMDQELRKKGIYGITDICRSYSQRKFKKAPGNKCPPPSRIPVPPNRTGPSSSRGTSTTGTSTSR